MRAQDLDRFPFLLDDNGTYNRKRMEPGATCSLSGCEIGPGDLDGLALTSPADARHVDNGRLAQRLAVD
jgi:hypothetical protein